MKVLWFTNTPSMASKYYGCNYYGASWESSLEKALCEHTNVELGIAFFTNSSKMPKRIGKSSYYPIKIRESSIQKIINRNFSRLIESKYLKDHLKIIIDFKPDVIQIFGTETGFSYVSGITDVPICVHIQGILTDCQNYFLNDEIKQRDLFKYSPFSKILKGTSLLHVYWDYKARAKRELLLLHTCNHYLGRTKYDRAFIERNTKNAKYFHLDELYREEFYTANSWNPPRVKKFTFLSINNGEVYKGIDIILRTANILKKLGLSFEWCIAGVEESNMGLNLFEKKLRLSHKMLDVKLLGKLSSQEIVNQMQISNLFIHTSRIDNSPNSVCEAMLVGMPIIAFNVGGISSLLSNDTGILIDQLDYAILADKIICAISDTQFLVRIGRNARQVASNRYDRKKVSVCLESYYRTIMEKHVVV